MNLLDLSGYDILNVDETDFEILITVKVSDDPTACLKCGVVSSGLTHFGTKRQLFNDLPIRAKRVGLRIIRQRYECADCQGHFFCFLPWMREDHRMTKRLYHHIQQQSLVKQFTAVANDVGVDEKLVRVIFKEYVKELKKLHPEPKTPIWMGIDELTLLDKPRCVITDVRERTIIDLLKDRTKKTVAPWLSKLPDRDKIEYVTMDMWNPYRELVNQYLPQAKIIADKFHVLDLANDCLDSARKSIHESLTDKQRRTLKHDRFVLLTRKHRLKPEKQLILEVWIKNFPLLGSAYELKEEFYDIWDLADDGKQAKKLYDDWKKKVPKELKGFYKPLTTAMTNWEIEVFAYFDANKRITNAYTEALNGLTKLTNRNGRGYSFDVVRAKILYNGEFHKVEFQSFRSAWDGRDSGMVYDTSVEHFDDFDFTPVDVPTGWPYTITDYGTSIPTLYNFLRKSIF